MTQVCKFASEQTTRSSGPISFGLMRPKWRYLVIMHSAIIHSEPQIQRHTHPLPIVKDVGGGQMIWTCFAATGPEKLAVIETMINLNKELKEGILYFPHNCILT